MGDGGGGGGSWTPMVFKMVTNKSGQFGMKADLVLFITFQDNNQIF